MLSQVTDRVRVLIGGALQSTRGDGIGPVRLVRQALGTANDLVGRPFCTHEELERRRGMAEAPAPAPSVAPAVAEPAPVMVYVDGRDHRAQAKLEELLRGQALPFQVLDVADDEATRSWAISMARSEELPLLFIAGVPVGGLHEVMQLDVNGELKRRVLGG